MKKLVFLLSIAASCVLAPIAQATETYPSRPVRIIVPFTPGSGTDINARFVADQLAKELGQPFIVENKAGANGSIAMGEVNRTTADGYTLVMAIGTTMSINPLMMKALPYKPEDFVPVSGIARGPTVLVVPSSSPFQNLKELVSYARENPGRLNAANHSAGYRLGIAWFSQLADIKVTEVPYKGATQLFTDLMGGQVDFALTDMAGSLPHINAGKIRALAVTGDTRNPHLPKVPTAKESGYGDFETYVWVALYARKGTPDAAIETLHAAMQKIMNSPAATKFLETIGMEKMAFSPERMDEFQRNEYAIMTKVAESVGIEPQ